MLLRCLNLQCFPEHFRYKNGESSWAKVILSPLLVQELFEVAQLSLMTNWYNFILFLAQALTRLTQQCLQDQSGQIIYGQTLHGWGRGILCSGLKGAWFGRGQGKESKMCLIRHSWEMKHMSIMAPFFCVFVFGVFVLFCLVCFGLVFLFIYLVWFVYLLVVEVLFWGFSVLFCGGAVGGTQQNSILKFLGFL